MATSYPVDYGADRNPPATDAGFAVHYFGIRRDPIEPHRVPRIPLGAGEVKVRRMDAWRIYCRILHSSCYLLPLDWTRRFSACELSCTRRHASSCV